MSSFAVAIGLESCWSVEHPSLTCTFNFGENGSAFAKREALLPADIEDNARMYKIYHDPRTRNHGLVPLTWQEYCDTGFANAWFEVGPADDADTITDLVNLSTNVHLRKYKRVWEDAGERHKPYTPADIVEGLHFVRVSNLENRNVHATEALTANFYNLLCKSQGFDQV